MKEKRSPGSGVGSSGTGETDCEGGWFLVLGSGTVMTLRRTGLDRWLGFECETAVGCAGEGWADHEVPCCLERLACAAAAAAAAAATACSQEFGWPSGPGELAFCPSWKDATKAEK